LDFEALLQVSLTGQRHFVAAICGKSFNRNAIGVRAGHSVTSWAISPSRAHPVGLAVKRSHKSGAVQLNNSIMQGNAILPLFSDDFCSNSGQKLMSVCHKLYNVAHGK
jgi:hypothetical protein